VLIDHLRRRRVRVLLQIGALIVVAAMLVTPYLDVGRAGSTVADLLVGLLILATVKGLIVVAVAAHDPRAGGAVSQAALEQPVLDPRELRELHELLERFFDEDPSVSGKVERLARMVEPVVAADSVRGQELLALRERIERLERLGGS
jgi:hypothetical protein